MFEGGLMDTNNYLAEFFKVLGDPTRLNILNTLFEQEKSVGVIAKELNMSDSAISHQLKILKTHRLIKNQKRGKEVYYSLDDKHVFDILHLGDIHIKEGIQ